MTTAATPKQLTDGQKGVISMYDSEIKHNVKERNRAATAGQFDEARYYSDKIDELENERNETLAKFLAS